MRISFDASEVRKLTESDPTARSADPGRRSRRRLFTGLRLAVILVLAFLVVAVFAAPLLAGYLGPRKAIYVAVWRPWRYDFSVQDLRTAGDAAPAAVAGQESWPRRLDAYLANTDCDGGWFVTVTRSSPSAPWRVTSLSPDEGV